uniref:ubiquitin carboxyl-terminal hydrolase 14-like n=1 Tax=Myxine glutinosa TaxID=7769 RepID=UPI00358FB91C
MPVFTVHVKWGKEKLQDVRVDTESPPRVFKLHLSELTGVSPHRQKVLVRGISLKDDEWGKFQIKDGSTLLLMGSVEELPSAPAERPTFVEDFSEAHLANVMDLPTGLVNLGNTCYLNATVQCLRRVPELREALKRYKGSVQTTAIANSAESITAALRDLFDSLERDGQAVPPIILLQRLQSACPQFAQKGDRDEYMLQDARECCKELLNRLTKLPSWEDHKEDKPQDKSFVEEFFGLELCSAVTCGESTEASDVTSRKEKRLHLSCVAKEDATTLEAGLQLGLVDELNESRSHGEAGMSLLESSQICRLPTYFVVLLDCKRGQDDGPAPATLLPKVTFPMNLDALPLCSASLKRSLLTQRQREAEVTENAGKLPNIESITRRTLQVFDLLHGDTGANSHGLYKLRAVISYDRSSVSAGHYLAWLSGKKGDWIKCNDTNMEVVCEQAVQQICAAESPHTACVFLYVSEPMGKDDPRK